MYRVLHISYLIHENGGDTMAGKLMGDELIISHIPKHYNYCFKFKDPTLESELSPEFDWSLIDTVNNPELINKAVEADYTLYERQSVSSAKKPTILDRGVILCKKLATKTDKKLENVGVGFFTHNGMEYVSTKLIYERFDIYEIFCLI